MSKSKFFNIASSIILSWFIFEIFIDNNYRQKLRKQLLKIISDSKSDRFIEYYSNDTTLINNEISSIKNDERNHTLISFKKTFIYKSSSNLESYINKLNLYGKMRNTNNINLIFQKTNNICNYLISIDNMLWYPYIFRILFSIFNFNTRRKWNLKYNFELKYFEKSFCYILKKKDKSYNKTLLIFTGLGGILQPFDPIIDIFLNKNYQIIIPIYGPSQASLDYNIDCHEAEFHEALYTFISNRKVEDLEILCWSLGGILYKGFENYVDNCSNYNFNIYNENINIKKVFLFEPLLGIRSSMDTYFSQIRNYRDTLYLMNMVTNEKYSKFNYVFSYFVHTVVGFSTCTSFGYFSTIELKNRNPYLNFRYPRYLFISSDDFVFNKVLDKDLIDSNFEKENIFYKKGYHGGWLSNRYLASILNKLLIN